MDRDLRMNSYYYSFEPTGAHPIDRVLSAVAEAGKSYHNTSEWTDGTDWQGNPQAPHPEFGGASCAEWIQNAANDAAAALAAETARADREAAARQEAERERDEARKVVENTLWMAGRYADGRMTYAVGLYNDMREIAQTRGDYAGNAKSAQDGMEPDRGVLADRLYAAEAERDRLRAELAALRG